MRRLVMIGLAAAFAAGCATPTVYGPVARPGASGYSETALQHDRWRITFSGGSDADRNRVADLALRRAAEVTLAQGFDWFRVVERHGDVRPPNGPTLSIGGGTESWGRSGGVSVGGAVGGIPLGGGPRISETVEIVMSKGSAPHEADAYDAKDVVASIRP